MPATDPQVKAQTQLLDSESRNYATYRDLRRDSGSIIASRITFGNQGQYYLVTWVQVETQTVNS